MIRNRLWLSLAGFFPWGLLAISIALVAVRLPNLAAALPLWRPWAEVGVLALGMTAVLLAGGIDLSVGSIVTLSGMVLGLLWKHAGWPIEIAAIGCVATGALAGALNGVLVALGIAPLLATLATMALYSGLAMALSQGARIAEFPESFRVLGNGSLWGLPNQLLLLAGCSVIVGLLVHATRFGRSLYALGDNRQAAEFAAVPVRRVDGSLYALSGLLAGLVAVWFTSRRGAAVADAGAGLELQAIACVVLGGTRVTGGAGSVGRTLLGLGVLANLELGLRLWGNQRIAIPGTSLGLILNANTRLIVVGVLLIMVAIFNERLSPNHRESSR